MSIIEREELSECQGCGQSDCGLCPYTNFNQEEELEYAKVRN